MEKTHNDSFWGGLKFGFGLMGTLAIGICSVALLGGTFFYYVLGAIL